MHMASLTWEAHTVPPPALQRWGPLASTPTLGSKASPAAPATSQPTLASPTPGTSSSSRCSSRQGHMDGPQGECPLLATGLGVGLPLPHTGHPSPPMAQATLSQGDLGPVREVWHQELGAALRLLVGRQGLGQAGPKAIPQGLGQVRISSRDQARKAGLQAAHSPALLLQAAQVQAQGKPHLDQGQLLQHQRQR